MRPRRRALRTAAGALGALLLLLLILPGAAAHADLASAEPPPNSRVDQAPAELRLRFTERLSDQYTGVDVVDGNGTDYVNETRIGPDDRTRVTATLDPMPDGVYSVRWRTLSAEDGHTRSGVYFLAVNASLESADDGGVRPEAPADEVPPMEPVFRTLGFAGASLAAGLPLFLWLTRGAGLTPATRTRLDALLVAGAGTAALAALGLAAVLAGRIDASLATALATEPGRLLAWRAGLFAAAGVAFLVMAVRRWPRARLWLMPIGTLLALAGVLATSLGSHAAADPAGRTWPIANDWLHQVAVAFWVSGVLALVVAALDKGTTESTGAGLVRRFSPWAITAVLVIVATGTLAGWLRVGDPTGLWTSTYGLVLLAKVAILLPLVALGAYHRYRVLPDLEVAGDRHRDFNRLKYSAGIEVGLMVVVLVAAGLLTSLAPPQAGASAEAEDRPLYAFEDEGLRFRVYVTPAPPTVGFQEIFLKVDRPDGTEVNRSAHKAILYLHAPSGQGGEATPREAHLFANGSYHWSGPLLTEPGNWTARIVFQGGQGDAFVYVDHRFAIDVRPRG